mmetsp:Transcript_10173/g.22022  ORF Transcript_10173/g.22022 Transcript_10173/m.22022 type:complete len:95 (-) Transcript_10173:632-916(-)
MTSWPCLYLITRPLFNHSLSTHHNFTRQLHLLSAQNDDIRYWYPLFPERAIGPWARDTPSNLQNLRKRLEDADPIELTEINGAAINVDPGEFNR